MLMMLSESQITSVFEMTRRLVAEEGIFAGASCGSALAGAMRIFEKEHDGEGMVAVVILPDSAKNYLSKVFNDRWMEENGFMDAPAVRGYGFQICFILSQSEKWSPSTIQP